MQTAKQNIEVLKTLKIHIGMGLTDEVTEDKTLDIQIRIAEIDAEFQKMLKAVSADNADSIDEERITELMNEKQRLTVQLEQYAAMRQKRESAKSRLDEIYTILDGLQNHPMEYDDSRETPARWEYPPVAATRTGIAATFSEWARQGCRRPSVGCCSSS